MRMFENEWLKIRHCKQLWLFFLAAVCFVALISFAPDNHYPMPDSGCTASFVYFRESGCIVLLLLSCVAEVFFTREMQQGTMQNSLCCGISRGQYFAAKSLCCLGTGGLIYLFTVLENVCIRTAMCGFWPEGGPGYLYSDYLLTLIAYHLGFCIPFCALLSLYILVAVWVRRPAVVYLAGLVTCVADLQLDMAFPGWRGPYAVMFDMEDMAAEGSVMTGAFTALFAQCALMGILFLASAYLVFRKKDIH